MLRYNERGGKLLKDLKGVSQPLKNVTIQLLQSINNGGREEEEKERKMDERM